MKVLDSIMFLCCQAFDALLRVLGLLCCSRVFVGCCLVIVHACGRWLALCVCGRWLFVRVRLCVFVLLCFVLSRFGCDCWRSVKLLFGFWLCEMVYVELWFFGPIHCDVCTILFFLLRFATVCVWFLVLFWSSSPFFGLCRFAYIGWILLLGFV